MRDDRLESNGPEPVDEVLGALVTRLQVMPASDPRARAAILARVRGRRQSPWRSVAWRAWQPSVPLLAAATLVVAAIGVGYAGRVLVEPLPATLSSDGGAADATAGLSVVPVSNSSANARLVPQQFVFTSAGANRVSVVGDFNGWDASAATSAMKDPSRSGVWEVTLLLPPGRHTYAFLVNDSLLVADPRMPKEAKDADFGREVSVILVNER